MAKKSLNRTLNSAKKAKYDEFYTQLEDIEAELEHYERHFKGKVVLCNCDDPRVSKFFHYFSYNFEYLGLKKLITTCYKSKERDLFSCNDSERAIMLEYDGNLNKNRKPDPKDIGDKELQGTGDFRSAECIELLKQADIVVTNPPFSLFREYVALLMKHKKKFLILGNINAISYKEFFPLIKSNQIWLGVNNGGKLFGVPASYEKELVAQGKDYKIVDGEIKVSMGNVVWYSNLDHKKRHEDPILYKKYNKKDYPIYDNYKAINVARVKDIPCDYAGIMGVPISFLDKYNPDQFEIIGSCYEVKQGLLPELINPKWKCKIDRGYINGKRRYDRLLIRNKKVKK